MWNSLLVRFRRDPVQGTVLISVLAIHFFFILIILVSPTFVFRKKEHKPLIVKTIVPRPVTKTAAAPKKSPRPNSAPAPKVSAAPPVKKLEAPKMEVAKTQPKKDPPPKTVAVKKETPPAVKKDPAIADKVVSKSNLKPAKKNPPPQQNRAKISDSLLQELEESIAKIENKSDKGATVKRAPDSSKTFAPILLQIDSPIGNDASAEEGESDYTDTLVSHLHRSLSLPDYGEVKIQLSLRQDGTVAKLIVLKTQSEKNKQYLESNLPRLRFPRFDGAYANKKEYTFILTFCNE